MKAMENPTLPATFDFNQRKIRPRRRDTFDKCRVFEIKNSALFLAFAFQDIKDIKRESASRIQTAGPGANEPSAVRLIFDLFGFGNQNSAERLGFFQRSNKKSKSGLFTASGGELDI
jgi:hypothetical protein